MKTAGPKSGRTAGNTALMTLAALMLSAVMAACSGAATPSSTTTPQAVTATAAPTETAWPTATAPAKGPLTAENTGTGAATHPKPEMCLEGDTGGERLNDLAEHIYDGAVARYLLENASGIGREITPDSEAHAVMLLTDDEAYETCVELPERCLRVQFLRTSSQAERDALLAGAASYAYDRAIACLQRAGDAYAEERPAPETEAGDLETKYRERILPRIIGNMMPVAMLVDSSSFGTGNERAHRVATEVWEDCLQTLSNKPVETERLAERVSEDKLAVLDCVEELHEKIPEWPEPTTAPESTATPQVEREPTPPPSGTTTPTATTGPAPPLGPPDTGPAEDWTRHSARNRGGGEVFSLMLPPGWELATANGIDSFVGEIRGDGVLLRFDLGWYSHEPKPERDPHNEYVVLQENIGGNSAKLVLAADPPEERKENYWAVTAVYFSHLDENNRFVMAGEGLTRSQQETALAVFRSIRMNRPSQEAGQNPPDNEHPAVAAAREAAAKHLGMEEQELVLKLQEAVQWASAALGCTQEGMAYAQVLTPGFLIAFAHGSGTVTVHTDHAGGQAVVPQNCLEGPETAAQPLYDGRTVHATLAPAGAPCPADDAGQSQASPILDGREYQLCQDGHRIGTFRGSFAPPHPSLAPTRLVESAVHEVYVEALEKYPVAYRLRVNSSRPSGSCTQHAGYEVRKIGRTVNVRILHHQGTGPDARCTKDMQEDRTVVPLGDDFDEGTEYELIVNQMRQLLTAEGR